MASPEHPLTPSFVALVEIEVVDGSPLGEGDENRFLIALSELGYKSNVRSNYVWS